MVPLDPTACSAAEKLFKTARDAKTELPTLLAEYDSYITLHTGMQDLARSALSDGQDALVDSVSRHGELLESITRQAEAMAEALEDAMAVISKLDDSGDRVVLRLYYIVGLSERQIPGYKVDGEKVWHYSPDYVPEKKAIALVHSAPILRELGLVGKYS